MDRACSCVVPLYNVSLQIFGMCNFQDDETKLSEHVMSSYLYNLLYLGTVWDGIASLPGSDSSEFAYSRKSIVEQDNPSDALAKGLYYDQLQLPEGAETCTPELARQRRDVWLLIRTKVKELCGYLGSGADRGGIPAHIAYVQERIRSKWETTAKRALVVIRFALGDTGLTQEGLLQLPVPRLRQLAESGLAPLTVDTRTGNWTLVTCDPDSEEVSESTRKKYYEITTARAVLEKFATISYVRALAFHLQLQLLIRIARLSGRLLLAKHALDSEKLTEDVQVLLMQFLSNATKVFPHPDDAFHKDLEFQRIWIHDSSLRTEAVVRLLCTAREKQHNQV
jgi:hypothetical protein